MCKVPTKADDVEQLIAQLTDDLGTMAMVDYPYPTSFIEPLPAWPVKYACDRCDAEKRAHPLSEYKDLYGIAAAAQTFYNYTGSMECLDTSTSSE